MPRIVTYNVHRCVGTDRRLDVGRVADVLAGLEPDIVALQELDVGRARTGGVDQAHEIARRLEMAFHFHPAMTVEEERYGDAILTIRPERKVQVGPLPGYAPVPRLEPRGALWVAIEIDGREVQVINTHLGLVPKEQLRQAEHLAGPGWLGHPDCRDPVILLGDFNATSASPVVRALTRGQSPSLTPARLLSPQQSPTATFPSGMPVLRIDHLFVSDSVSVRDVFAPYTPLTLKASDHLPLVMDFDLA
ncbi:MAG TPA: endonuclease/exonuclease/phosphatase family protein [Phenylobacterium sp.]|nr:endonuclease/exonuclease/phosphatase family protein [Phenylobacterium sp.]HQN50752.1 endonuclease/exonuclease/phosphatase family protein [Phenylobacterium sp.]HQP20784.1 endonuclease/exonuclease/phosphatase family protein [Phenylobacterium sp.]